MQTNITVSPLRQLENLRRQKLSICCMYSVTMYNLNAIQNFKVAEML